MSYGKTFFSPIIKLIPVNEVFSQTQCKAQRWSLFGIEIVTEAIFRVFDSSTFIGRVRKCIDIVAVPCCIHEMKSKTFFHLYYFWSFQNPCILRRKGFLNIEMFPFKQSIFGKDSTALVHKIRTRAILPSLQIRDNFICLRRKLTDLDNSF